MRLIVAGGLAGLLVGGIVGAGVGYAAGQQAVWAIVTHKMRRAK